MLLLEFFCLFSAGAQQLHKLTEKLESFISPESQARICEYNRCYVMHNLADGNLYAVFYKFLKSEKDKSTFKLYPVGCKEKVAAAMIFFYTAILP